MFIVVYQTKLHTNQNHYIVSGNIWLLINVNLYWYIFINCPYFHSSQHQAAVKALDWCPWQTNVLASGGGTADRTIRFWNCNNGQCINSVNANSQVCAILWSKTYRELVSAHGFANNQLTIWKYPSLTKVS